MTELAEKWVAAGAEWLDTVNPDWFNQVDFDKLDMWDSHLCIAGQTLGILADDAGIDSGFNYVMFVGAQEVGLDKNATWTQERGFLPMVSGIVDAWVEQTALRKQAVNVR